MNIFYCRYYRIELCEEKNHRSQELE